jgi:hypothetical protein
VQATSAWPPPPKPSNLRTRQLVRRLARRLLHEWEDEDHHDGESPSVTLIDAGGEESMRTIEIAGKVVRVNTFRLDIESPLTVTGPRRFQLELEISPEEAAIVQVGTPVVARIVLDALPGLRV